MIFWFPQKSFRNQVVTNFGDMRAGKKFTGARETQRTRFSREAENSASFVPLLATFRLENEDDNEYEF